MDIINLLENRAVKPLAKRAEIAQAISIRQITIKDIQALKGVLNDKHMALVLESMEAVSGKTPAAANLEWLLFAQDFIPSKSNPLKREASRIIGNIAQLFPNDLSIAISRLLDNAKDAGTVVRWGSAYALARIIQIPHYANSELYNTVLTLSLQEQENGVKNQLLGGLKKAGKIRK